MNKLLIGIIGILALVACDKEDFDSTTLKQEPNNYSFDVGTAEAKANGKDSIIATVQLINPPQDLRNQEATFTIEPVGYFANGTNQITVTLEEHGTNLTSVPVYSIEPGTSNLKVVVGDYNRIRAVKFTRDESFATALTVTAADGNAIADGEDVEKITIALATSEAKTGDLVNLKIEPMGQFVQSGTNVLELNMPSSGTIDVYVKSSSSGLARVAAIYGNLRDMADVTFDPAIGSVDLTIITDVAADNYSTSEITASLDYVAGANVDVPVVFTATKGTFSNGDKTITLQTNSLSKVKVYLKHSAAESVEVTVKIDGLPEVSGNVTFSKAYPELILVQPSESRVEAEMGKTIEIKATLIRANGIATPGCQILFTDSALIGKNPGAIINQTFSDAAGIATAQYVVQDSTFAGFVDLKAIVKIPGSTKDVVGIGKIYISAK